MTEDLTGTWEGIYATGTARGYEAYGGPLDAFDVDPKIRQTGDIVAADHGVRLVITSQSAYKKFVTSRAPSVSIIAGQLEYLEVVGMSDPVSGFVNDAGLVSLSIYQSDPRGDQVCVGRLTHSGLTREISGNVMIRVAPPGTGWPDLFTSYYFGRLSVRNNGLGANDRAYTVDYGHVF